MKIFLLLISLSTLFCQKMTSTELNKVASCVACRFIWENIEEALGTSQRNAILAAEAYQYYCKISPDIFYQPCNDMFEQLFEMSDQFAKGQKIDSMCETAKMCDKKDVPAQSRFQETDNQRDISGNQMYNHFDERKKLFEAMQNV